MQVNRNGTKGHEEERDNVNQIPKGEEIRPKETWGEAVLGKTELDFLGDKVEDACKQEHVREQVLEWPEALIKRVEMKHRWGWTKAERENKEKVDDAIDHSNCHCEWAKDSLVQGSLDDRSHCSPGNETCIKYAKDADQTTDTANGIIQCVPLLPEMTQITSIDHFGSVRPG